MKNRRIYLWTILLLLITVAAAIFHLTNRQQVDTNYVQLKTNHQVYDVSLSELDCEPVKGVRINGKGEEVEVSGQGIALNDLLASYQITDYSEVTFLADDSYSAVVTVEEIQEAEKVYLLVEEEEMRLVVFGDSDSKRSVSNVKQICVE